MTFGNTSSSALPCTAIWELSYGAAAVLLVGFLACIYLFAANPIVNPDGFLYVQQAKALCLGPYDQILNCYVCLSPYSIVIAMAYRLLGDWVLAAQWVNLVFYTVSILPLYCLLRCFFKDPMAWITFLIYALLPAYVLVSRDMLRGPMFWFFAAIGLHFSVLNIDRRRPFWLILSNTCFVIGAWSRIEGSLVIAASALFLVLKDGKHRFLDLICFLATCAIIGIFGGTAAYFQDIDLPALLKPERIPSRLTGSCHHYNMLREQLKNLYDTDLVDSGYFFFRRVRNLVWLIALGALTVLLAETLLYVFLIVFVAAIVFLANKATSDPRILYLGSLSFLSFVLLYMQAIYNWAIASRFLAVFLFPAFVFMGTGIERFSTLLSSRFTLNNKKQMVVLCAIIFASLIPKTLIANYDEEKLIFRQIADQIVKREKNLRSVTICGAFKHVRVIHFFPM